MGGNEHTSDLSSIQSQVSGASADITEVVNSILGAGDTIIGIPNTNTGSRAQGARCTNSSSHTTLFTTQREGFCFVQAHNSPSAGGNAEVILYHGVIGPEHIVAYAELPPGTSQIVGCYPAYSEDGFIITAKGDGTNNVCVFFQMYSTAPQATSEFQTGEDSYLEENAPTTNRSGQNTWRIGNFAGPTTQYNGIIRPDVSGITPGTIISQAILQVKKSLGSATVNDIHVREVLQNWVNAEVTWNEYSSGNAWNTAGGEGSGTDLASTDLFYGDITINPGELFEIDITQLVQAWVDGSKTNNGILFYKNPIAVSNNLDFHSYQAADSANRPKLIVSTL